jgi:hypothetical protein
VQVVVHWPLKQTSCSPVHATGVSQSVQPELITLQVETLFGLEHIVASSVHWSLHVVVHLPPEQTSCSPVHEIGVSQSVQPELITLHVETPVPEHIVAPSVHWLLHGEVEPSGTVGDGG